MVITTKIISIAVIIVAMLIGLIVFYVMSDESTEYKKQQINELTSQLINLVIFIWLGKIFLNLSLFIQDPLAILAYPSSKESFYIAVLLSAITLAIQSYRKKISLIPFFYAFIQVFLISSFLYEFYQFVWEDHAYSFGYVVLSAVLLFIFYLVRDHLSKEAIIMHLLIGWSLGMMVLAFIQPYVMVFDYQMEPWFIGVFYIVCFSIILVIRRKRLSQ